MRKRRLKLRLFTGLLLYCSFIIIVSTQAIAQQGAKNGEWHVYGGDNGSTKYSALDRINRENAGKLQIAWTWESPDLPLQKENRMLSSIAFETTPLMVGGVLYASTSLSQLAAINAQTGETIWVFNPESYKSGRPTNLGFVHRGLAYWSDGKAERLFIATGDAYLWAVDAKTGKAVDTFG